MCESADLLCLPLRFDPIDSGWRQARKVYNCQTRGSSVDLWRPPLWRQVSLFETQNNTKANIWRTCHVWKVNLFENIDWKLFLSSVFPLLSEKKTEANKILISPIYHSKHTTKTRPDLIGFANQREKDGKNRPLVLAHYLSSCSRGGFLSSALLAASKGPKIAINKQKLSFCKSDNGLLFFVGFL